MREVSDNAKCVGGSPLPCVLSVQCRDIGNTWCGDMGNSSEHGTFAKAFGREFTDGPRAVEDDQFGVLLAERDELAGDAAAAEHPEPPVADRARVAHDAEHGAGVV